MRDAADPEQILAAAFGPAAVLVQHHHGVRAGVAYLGEAKRGFRTVAPAGAGEWPRDGPATAGSVAPPAKNA